VHDECHVTSCQNAASWLWCYHTEDAVESSPVLGDYTVCVDTEEPAAHSKLSSLRLGARKSAANDNFFHNQQHSLHKTSINQSKLISVAPVCSKQIGGRRWWTLVTSVHCMWCPMAQSLAMWWNELVSWAEWQSNDNEFQTDGALDAKCFR